VTLRWRPTAAQERWLALPPELRDRMPPALLQELGGGWRGTGLLARIALFALGLIAAALSFGLVGAGQESSLLVAGLLAVVAAEWLKLTKRLHGSGIEEGLCVAGFLLLGGWVVVTLHAPLFRGDDGGTLLLVAAAGLAGLRLLNPLVTTGAVVALVGWAASTDAGGAIDRYLGAGAAAFVLAFAVAMIALALGAREYRRPSHDRMLDWLVAVLPIVACVQWAPWVYVVDAFVEAEPGFDWRLRVAVLLAAGTALLVTGVRRRRHAPLVGFLACLAGLAVELRLALRLPNEAWLLACGSAALLSGAVLDRYLRTPRNNVTSAPQPGDGGLLDPLQAAGAAVLTQQSSPAATVDDGAMRGGGGRFGGGGASGNY
jgi:hypothetical protein